MAALEALAPGPMSVLRAGPRRECLDRQHRDRQRHRSAGSSRTFRSSSPTSSRRAKRSSCSTRSTVTDEQGSTDTKIVEVDITGTNAAATVWIHTTTDGNDNNWTTGANWGTGKAPTAVDDVIIVTDQLHPNTPAYPATITSGTNAAAHSVVMNDFVASPGENIPPVLEVDERRVADHRHGVRPERRLRFSTIPERSTSAPSSNSGRRHQSGHARQQEHRHQFRHDQHRAGRRYPGPRQRHQLRHDRAAGRHAQPGRQCHELRQRQRRQHPGRLRREAGPRHRYQSRSRYARPWRRHRRHRHGQ